MDVPPWLGANSCPDFLRFLKGEFCTPLGVYVASLLHGVGHYLGTLGVGAPVPVHVGVDAQCGWRKLPHLVKDYNLGRH